MGNGIPKLIRWPVPGCDDVLFTREDFTDRDSWYKFLLLTSGGFGYTIDDMKMYDFRREAQWRRYWILTMGLTEGIVILGGDIGSGKSLFMYWLAYRLKTLFGKRATFDIPPEESFGDFDVTSADIFITEWAELTKLALKKGLEKPTPEFLTEHSSLYNRAYGLDEAHKHMPKRGLTKYGMLLHDFNLAHRHLHNLMMFPTAQPKSLAIQELTEIATHFIICAKDRFEPDLCTYQIKRKRPEYFREMELHPNEWSHLWDTHSLIGMRENVDPKLLKQLNKEIKEHGNEEKISV